MTKGKITLLEWSKREYSKQENFCCFLADGLVAWTRAAAGEVVKSRQIQDQFRRLHDQASGTT